MLKINQCWTILESHVGGASKLPAGATDRAIRQAETKMSLKLPEDLRKSLRRHDGSGEFFISPYKIGGGGQSFMNVKDIVNVWKGMVQIAADFEERGDFGEQIGPVKRNHWNRRWVPFMENGCGDNIIVDLDPADGGTRGQVVDWWHEGAVSTYQAPSIREWLNEVIREIEKGVYRFADNM